MKMLGQQQSLGSYASDWVLTTPLNQPLTNANPTFLVLLVL